MGEVIKLSEQPASIQAAVALENRLTSMEAELKHMAAQHEQTNKTLSQLVERVGLQNGRVSKVESAVLEVKKQIADQEELIAKPRWANFETVKTKVETMWTEFSMKGLVEEKRERFWAGLKRRADIILIAVSIVVALRIEFIWGLFGG